MLMQSIYKAHGWWLLYRSHISFKSGKQTTNITNLYGVRIGKVSKIKITLATGHGKALCVLLWTPQYVLFPHLNPSPYCLFKTCSMKREFIRMKTMFWVSQIIIGYWFGFNFRVILVDVLLIMIISSIGEMFTRQPTKELNIHFILSSRQNLWMIPHFSHLRLAKWNRI